MTPSAPSHKLHRRGWLCGWSLDTAAFAEACRHAFPGEEPIVEPATAAGLERLLAAAPDALGGYSLGAWLLLDAAAAGRTLPDDIVLAAPFLAFPAESALGGRIHRAQLAYMKRWIARDAAAAVADFRQRAGLTLPAAPADRDSLAEGLDHLASPGLAALPPAAKAWTAVAGAEDALLDNTVLAQHWPSLKVQPATGHDAPALLDAAAKIHRHAL